MTRMRLGMIGLGMAAGPHAKSLVDLSDRVGVVRACSPSAARRDAFAQQFDFPLTGNVQDIIGDPAIEAVLVLTPPNTHLELTQACAAAGKHVLLEKPLEVTLERSLALVETCRGADVRLAVMLQHRYRPAALRLKQLLAGDRLGPIAGASVAARVWRPQSYYDQPGRGTRWRDGGGVLLTQAIHTLDLLLHLVGPVREVMAYAQTSPLHRMETEDMVCAALQFADGALGSLDATTAAYPGFPERIDLTCRNGTASLAGTGLNVLYHDGSRETVAPDLSAGGTGADPMAFPHDYHRALIGDFLDAVATGREPAVSGAEALQVHRFIDGLLRSAAAGQRVLL